MATCGSCKATGQTIEHIKACYAAKRGTIATVEVTGFAKTYVEQRDFTAMALNVDVPASKYALYDGDGKIIFYEVRIGKAGTRWDGFRFVDHLVGHPGDWARYPVKGEARKQLLLDIGMNPKAAAVRFSKHFTICAVCSSPLSDPESVAAGLGPICAQRF
jgi:hypothetical protein